MMKERKTIKQQKWNTTMKQRTVKFAKDRNNNRDERKHRYNVKCGYKRGRLTE